MKIVALLVCATACASSTSNGLSTERVAFDLECPANQVRSSRLDSDNMGAWGCGRRANYVKACGVAAGHRSKRECSWQLKYVSDESIPKSNDVVLAPE